MKNATLSGSMPERNFIGRFVESNRKTIVEVVAALFILLFVYTGVNKFIEFNSLKFALKDYPIIGNISIFIVWLLPSSELLIALLLFIPKTKLWGLYSSLLLMTTFTLYLGYILIFSPKLPCTCGGMLQKLSWPQHLAFNILFIILSLLGILLYKKKQ